MNNYSYILRVRDVDSLIVEVGLELIALCEVGVLCGVGRLYREGRAQGGGTGAVAGTD